MNNPANSYSLKMTFRSFTFDCVTFQVKWRLPDGEETSRHSFMRVLSDIQAIYIRASYGGDASNLESLRLLYFAPPVFALVTLFESLIGLCFCAL